MAAEHVRHKTPIPLERPRQLVLACPGLRSSVNLSRLVRLAGCIAAKKIVTEGNLKIDATIARDAADSVVVERRRTLLPALKRMAGEGYRLVALEQTDRSESLFTFSFPRETVLVIGHERLGLSAELLSACHDFVEIPVYGAPASYNIVTATTMAVYEYCRQFPTG